MYQCSTVRGRWGDESKVRTTLRRYSRMFKCSDSRVNTNELWYSSPSTLRPEGEPPGTGAHLAPPRTVASHFYHLSISSNTTNIGSYIIHPSSFLPLICPPPFSLLSPPPFSLLSHSFLHSFSLLSPPPFSLLPRLFKMRPRTSAAGHLPPTSKRI